MGAGSIGAPAATAGCKSQRVGLLRRLLPPLLPGRIGGTWHSSNVCQTFDEVSQAPEGKLSRGSWTSPAVRFAVLSGIGAAGSALFPGANGLHAVSRWMFSDEAGTVAWQAGHCTKRDPTACAFSTFLRFIICSTP